MDGFLKKLAVSFGFIQLLSRMFVYTPGYYDTWKSFREKIINAFSARLNAYKEKKQTRSGQKHPPYTNPYQWLADYQIGQKSFGEIARAVPSANGGFDRSGVSRAVKSLARDIGLTLRPSVKR